MKVINEKKSFAMIAMRQGSGSGSNTNVAVFSSCSCGGGSFGN